MSIKPSLSPICTIKYTLRLSTHECEWASTRWTLRTRNCRITLVSPGHEQRSTHESWRMLFHVCLMCCCELRACMRMHILACLRVRPCACLWVCPRLACLLRALYEHVRVVCDVHIFVMHSPHEWPRACIPCCMMNRAAISQIISTRNRSSHQSKVAAKEGTCSVVVDEVPIDEVRVWVPLIMHIHVHKHLPTHLQINSMHACTHTYIRRLGTCSAVVEKRRSMRSLPWVRLPTGFASPGIVIGQIDQFNVRFDQFNVSVWSVPH